MDSPPDPQPPPPRRGAPLVLLGGLAALAAGGAIAWVLLGTGKGAVAPPPASEGGLVIESGENDQGRIDPARPLRCFVQGQYVGELSLTACAQRNGVATDALDVGIDETGALAAAEQAGQVLTPLPPEADLPAPADEAQPVAASPPAEDVAPGAPGACWQRGGGRWRKMSGDLDLDACVQALFAGHCEKPDGATYGRWGQQTLRRVSGRIEISDDNRTFRFLAPQAADCGIPPAG